MLVICRTGRALLLVILSLWSTSPGASDDRAGAFETERIAHAGGGLGRLTYTNSYEAMEQNLARGFVYFEIDFVFTRDGELVCLHDWEENFERTFGVSTDEPLTLAEFEGLVAKNERFTNCTLGGLNGWLSENPRAVIVTDVRGDLESALRKIAATIEDYRDRVIPQIYQPAEAGLVRELGFRSMIWTLYRYSGTTVEVLRRAAAWKTPVAVAMPAAWAESGLPLLLRHAGISSYAHTVNSREFLETLKSQGISEIYTDHLPPEGVARDDG